MSWSSDSEVCGHKVRWHAWDWPSLFLILQSPVLFFTMLDRQSGAWKHANPHTVWNLTDAGGPIEHIPWLPLHTIHVFDLLDYQHPTTLFYFHCQSWQTRMLADPAEKLPVYMISGNYGLTVHVSFGTDVPCCNCMPSIRNTLDRSRKSWPPWTWTILPWNVRYPGQRPYCMNTIPGPGKILPDFSAATSPQKTQDVLNT